jgi:beta-glucosidase-like glycosyl hydrolase
MAPRSAEMQRLRRAIAEDQVGGLHRRARAGRRVRAGAERRAGAGGVPLLIVSDLETGPGMRLTGGTNFPPAMAFGAAGSEALAREAGRASPRAKRGRSAST